MTSRNDFRSARMLFKSAVAAGGLLLTGYLLWKLRSLIPPVAVGGLVAYICRPLVAHLERYLVTRGLAIGLLLLAFVVAALFIVNRISEVMPTGIAAAELKVRGRYKINEGYQSMMGLDPSLARGNRIYRLVGAEMDQRVDWINRLLALTPEETSQFLASRPHGPDAPSGSDRLLDYYRANLNRLNVRAQAALPKIKGKVRAAPPVPAETPEPLLKTPLAILGNILSAWFIAPLVFLFLLGDTGEIKRGILSAVPNAQFEPALRVLEDLDRALGSYMRGLFLECALLGLSVTVFLALVGVSPRWAIAIGICTGASDVIPYMGTAFALVGGLAYALLAEDIRPLLPMVNPGNFVICVLAAVALAEVLKQVYEPIVLGGAAKLHPLVVLIGVVAGGVLFDLAGVLLAIPTITIFKVSISSTARQLKAYGLV